MRLYVLDQGDGLTGNWHSGGGLIVVAESREAANALIAADHAKNPDHDVDPYGCPMTANGQKQPSMNSQATLSRHCSYFQTQDAASRHDYLG